MLRVRALKDFALIKNNEFVKNNSERDLEFSLAIELYENKHVDILNPFLHEDLSKNIDLYREDWLAFQDMVKNKITEGVMY